MHAKITASPACVIVVAEAPAVSALAELLAPAVHHTPRPLAEPEALIMDPPANTVLHAAAQVNHCYAAWPAPKLGHPEAAACAVLAEWLTNEVLHRAIREEGGAYGAGASYDAVAGIFRMMSARDPRLLDTYADFDAAIASVRHMEMTRESIEEAIICVIRDLDRPAPPYRHAMRSWSRKRIGITDEMRNQFRAGVLACTADDMRSAAQAWLYGHTPSRCAFAGDASVERGDMRALHLAPLLN